MREIPGLLFAVALLSGCQTNEDGPSADLNPLRVASPTASAIAGDMASRFAEQMGRTGAVATIRMSKDQSEFAAALEAALKGWGYSVITEGKVAKDVRPVDLAYAIEGIDGQILARLQTPSVALSRIYAPTAAGAAPVSPLSIMQRN